MSNIIPNINNTSINQLDIFRANLPKRPYCTNDFDYGLRIVGASSAIAYKHIQPNPPNNKIWLLFDIDRAVSLDEITDDLLLPAPTFFVQNTKNMHAHLYYKLNTPVHMNEDSSQKAIRYAAAVDISLSQALSADAGYTGLIAKNPLHQHWRTYNTNLAYDLSDIAESLDLTPFNDKQKAMPEIGLGRNVTMFDTLRLWAYRAIRQGWPEFDQWHKACFDRAMGINVSFTAPLPLSEISSVAKSVARYVHKKYTPEGFSAIQSARGIRSGQARLALSQDKRTQARELAEDSVSKTEIARLLNVHRDTVHRWLK